MVEEVFVIESETMIAGIRGTEGVIELQENQITHLGIFEGLLEVFPRMVHEQQQPRSVMLGSGMQTFVERNKIPAKPFPLKKRMLKHKKKVKELARRMPCIKKQWNSLYAAKSIIF